MKWKMLAFSLLLLLLFIDFALFNIPIGPIRLTAIRLVIFSIIGIVLWKIVHFRDLRFLGYINYLTLFLGFWVSYSFISILWSVNRVNAIKEVYYLIVFVLLILCIIYLIESIEASLIKISLWITTAFVLGVSYIEYFTGRHLPTSRYVIEADSLGVIKENRATAFFYNDNDLGFFFVLMLPFILIQIVHVNIIIRIASSGLVVGILLLLQLNNARLAMVAAIIQVVLFAVIHWKARLKKIVRISLVFLPVIVGAITVIILRVLDKSTVLENFSQGLGSEFIRLNLYLNALYTTFKSGFIGVGAGNYQQTVSPLFNTLGKVDPHNWWLEILTNYGSIIFVGYIIFYLMITIQLFKIYYASEKTDLLAMGLFLMMVGLAIGSVAPSSVFYFWPMWLLKGVAIAYIFKKETSIPKKSIGLYQN